MARKTGDGKDQSKDPKRDDYTDLGVNDGSARTDYNHFDWSGKQIDDYKDVRRKGSDR